MNCAGYDARNSSVVAQRRPVLRERHRARVVPDVDHLGYPLRQGLALRAVERDPVHERPVRVESGQVPPGQLGQFGQRADAGQMGLRAHPQRQRRAPVPGPGQRPVHVVPQPLTVAAVLDRRRVPVRPLVLGQQLVLDRGGPDEPRGHRVVEQQGAAPPAVRVAVHMPLGPEQQAAVAEIADQPRVGVLEEHPADQRHVVLEVPVGPDRVDHGQAVRPRRLHVIGAERRRQVDEPGAILRSHE